MLFLVRPIEWRQVGGLQVVYDGLSLPIAAIVIFACLLGISSTVATWACLTADHTFIRFLSFVSILPVLALVNTSFDRALLSIVSPMRSSTDSFDILFVIASIPLLLLNVMGLLLPIILVGAIILCLLAYPERLFLGITLTMTLFAASIPVIQYLYVLLFAETTFWTGNNDIQITLRASIADGILSSTLAAIYLLAQWANTSAAVLIREVGQFARAIARLVKVRTIVMCLALAKVAYAILGFQGTLPRSLGGASPLWRHEVSASESSFITDRWLSWLVAVAVAIPIVALCAFARRLEDRSVPLEGWIVLFAILTSAGMIVETLLPVIDSAFPFVPLPDRDPLYLNNSTRAALEFILMASIAISLRRMNPHAAILFTIGIIVALPRTIEMVFAFKAGVLNFLMLDLLASAFAGIAMFVPSCARWRLPVAVYLIGSTVMILTHISIIEFPAIGIFGLGLGGSVLWYTFIRGGELKLLSAFDRSVLLVILASTALLTTILWSLHMFSGYTGWDVEAILDGLFRAALTSVGVPALLVTSATTFDHCPRD